MSNKKEMKDLVPSLETCKKLQEKGLCGKSVFCYIENERFPEFENQPIFRGNLNESDAMLPSIYDIIAPAPTTDEILAELPTTINANIYRFQFELLKFDKYYQVQYRCRQGMTEHGIMNPSLPQALADLHLKLKSEGII